MRLNDNTIREEQIRSLAQKTDGLSGFDVKQLFKEAANEVLRDIIKGGASEDKLREITIQDFNKQLIRVKPTVSSDSLKAFEEWNRKYGTSGQ